MPGLLSFSLTRALLNVGVGAHTWVRPYVEIRCGAMIMRGGHRIRRAECITSAP